MTRRASTQHLINEAKAILSAFHPMTVRQVYYQLVSRQVVENTRSRYQAVSDALVDARREGYIPWGWIEDRLRQPSEVNMWRDLADFAETARRAYKRNVWATQPRQLEVWLEKDALTGIFADVLEGYGVTLNVGRGYDGWSSTHNAAERYKSGKGVTILHFGDFDPRGNDMVRNLGERLAQLGSTPDIIKIALTREDVTTYQLPPHLAKETGSRRAACVVINGDMPVELDALPANVLQARLIAEVEQRLDLAALAAVRQQEALERKRLVEVLNTIGGEE